MPDAFKREGQDRGCYARAASCDDGFCIINAGIMKNLAKLRHRFHGVVGIK